MTKQEKLEAKKQKLEEMKAKREAMKQENNAKAKAMPKGMKIAYGVIAVVLIVVIAITSGGSSDDSETPNSINESQTPAETPAFEELTFEEQVKQISNKVSRDKVQQVLIGNGELSIDIEMTENFSNKLMVSGMERQAFSILKQLQGSIEGQGIDYVSIFFTASFIDKYGNESEDNAGIFAVHTEELMKVNFDNLTPDALENFCSTTYVHPAFKE